MFWDTLPGLIASWAAALAGITYLARRVWAGWRVGRRVSEAVSRLIEIGGTDSWPNGAMSLPAAMNEIYDRQSETHRLLQSYIVAHRTDHGLPPVESIKGTPQGF